jgi:hypothetical protein
VVVKFLIASAVMVFAFFEFYPQYVTPRYLPLVRQERYLELLLPAAVVVVGTALHRLSRHHSGVAAALLAVLLGDFVFAAARRSTLYNDSQQDMRDLAHYARSTIAGTGKPLFVDQPAMNALPFYLRDVAVTLKPIEHTRDSHSHDGYIAVGGARSFWWSPSLIFDVPPNLVPTHWILAWELPAASTPWRRSNLRVYYLGESAAGAKATAEAPRPAPPGSMPDGLSESIFPDGFQGRELEGVAVKQIPDLDNHSEVRAPHLQWTGWLQATAGLYTFESTSDDGSWIFVNERLILDNGGTHPARTMRGTMRLDDGWYRFRLRYEDTGGDRFLRVRVFKDGASLDLSRPGLFYYAP